MDVSSVTKHFATANKGFITTLGGTISASAATVPLTSVSGLVDGTVFVGIIEPGETKEQEFTGTVDTAGVQITGVEWTDGSDVGHTAGVTIVDYVSASGQNMLVKGLETEHNQDGTHSDITADTVTADSFIVTGTAGADKGWEVGLPAVSSVTANGNRSYDVEFASDVSATLSDGMRVRTTRTVAAPDQCADLEAASSQYFSKSSPTGISFTTTFTAMAWVKLESYIDGGIIARRNGDTEGWSFSLTANGNLSIIGQRITSNRKYIQSDQSIPLNKWVHVAACLDMTAGDTSTQKIWIDGVEVPRTYTLTGTATALVQGTVALTAGARRSDGISLLDGKLAQVGLFDAVLSEAQINEYMSRPLTGSETSNVGAWSLDDDLTDLSSSGNDLTASGGAVATDTDSPFGNKGVSTTLDYGLVMKVDTTTVTVQVPEGCTIPTSGGVSAVAYSTQAAPYGFPEISTSAIISRSVRKTTTQDTTSSTHAQINGLSLTVDSPGGGHDFIIDIDTSFGVSTANTNQQVKLWDGTVGSGTELRYYVVHTSAGVIGNINPFKLSATVWLSEGRHTLNVSFANSVAATFRNYADSGIYSTLTATAL